MESAATHVFATSSDGGATWSARTEYLALGRDPRDVCLTRLSSGRIMATFFDYASQSDFQSGVIWSDDDGATWSSPVLIESTLLPIHAISGPVIELANGDLLAPIYWYLVGGVRSSIVVVKSTDQGATWADLAVVADGDVELTGLFEANLLLLDNGIVYCAIRTQDEKMAWATSTDSGATWSAMSKNTLQSNGRPHVAKTTSGAVVWSSRTDGTIFYRTSWDNGQTWSTLTNLETGGFRGVYTQMVETGPNVLAVVWAMEFGTGGVSDLRFSYVYDENLTDPLA